MTDENKSQTEELNEINEENKKEQIKEEVKETDIEKVPQKAAAVKSGAKGTAGGDDEDPLTLAIQAAFKTDRRGKQETESEQNLLMGTDGGVNVTMESGDLSCECTEHVIHGKNGFEFPIKRIYDTATAKSDCPSMAGFIKPLKTNMPDTAWLLNQMGCSMNIRKVCEDCRMDYKITTDKVKEEVRKMGGSIMSLGAGWRLSLPYIDRDEVLHLPGGGQYITDDMTAASYTPYASGYDKCDAYEKHGGGNDFTFLVARKIKQKNAQGVPIAWETVFSQLVEKNGLSYIFNGDGNLTKITDASGTNVITVSYSSGLINEITEPFGSRMKFTYTTRDKYVCPVITRIALLNAAGTQTSTIEYTYKSLTGEWSGLNMLPLLEKAKDKGGRFTTYEYQKCSGIYAFYDTRMENSYLNGIVFNLSSYKTFSGNFNEKVGLETPHLLTKVTTPYGFSQTIGYGKETAVLNTDEAGSYTPTKKERMMVKSVMDKNGNTYKSRNYNYTQKLHANFQIFVPRAEMSENGRITVNCYEEIKDGDRYITHMKSSSLTIPLDKCTDITVSRTSYTWSKTDDRLTKEKTSKGKNSCETSYSYDNWGNVTTETVTKKYREDEPGQKTSTRTTKSKYFNTSSSGITGFPGGVPNTAEQTVKGTRSLLVNLEITDTVTDVGTTCRIQKGYAYDTYGRCTWEGIRNGNSWETTTYNYFEMNASNSWKGGLLMNRTIPSGQSYIHTYTSSNNNLTTKKMAILVSLGEPMVVGRNIITETVTDMQTGLVKSFKDGRGNITTYTYDSLGRKTSTVTPDGVTEQTQYNDSARTVTLRIKKAGESSYINRFKYEYDSKGNLTKKEQYNSIGTGDGNFSSITESYKYNCDDRPERFTDGNGDETISSYDLLGRVIKQTNPDGTENKREYDDINSIIKVTDEDGHTHNEYPDFDGQTVKTERKLKDTELITSACYYDVSGRTVRTTDGEGYSTDTFFSPFEKPFRQTGDAVIIRENGISPAVYPRREYEYTGDGLVKTEYDGYSAGRNTSLTASSHSLRTKKYTYNKAGWALSVESGFQKDGTADSDKRKTEYEYDLNGNVTKEKHEDGTGKSYAYDRMNRVASVTDECGNSTAFEYNHDGKLTKKTDSNGFVSEYIYDDFNRLVRAELPPVPGKTGKNIICIKYDRNGNVKEITEGDGKITVRDYDKLNRITAETVKKGSGSSEVKTVRGWKYNGNGSVAQEIQGGTSDSTGTAKTLYEYDVIGRLSKKTFPDGRIEAYTLDYNDRVTVLTHADNRERKTEYSRLGFITKETDEECFVTTHEYNVWGGEVYSKVKTSENGTEVRTWKTDYTVFGEVKSEESGDGRKWNYEYNSRGFLSKRTAPDGTVQTIGYDGCGRMTSDSRTLGSVSLTRNLVYDPVGFVKSGTDSGITTAFNLSGSAYTANAYGLVTGCKTTVSNKILSSTFSYDEGKRLKEIVYPDSAKTAYGYNGIGQLVSAGNTGSATAYANTGSYDTAGHLTSMKGGNSLIRTESWNNTNGLLESYSWGISGKTANTLAWNSRGNVTSQKKYDISYSYDYDKKGQLEIETKGTTQLNSWTYDANGNRITEKKDSGSTHPLDYYNKSDLVKSDGTWMYNYDANGNMTYKGKTATAKTNGGLFEGWTFDATSGEVWSYEYDLCNRLTKVRHSTAGTNNLIQVSEYKYDFRDLMVCRTTGGVSEYFAYDAEGKLIYTEKGTEKHNYVYANGKLWCETVTSGTTKNTYYHHTDHLGTTVCITDSSGAVAFECEKDAFGYVRDRNNNSFTPNFTGKLLDQNTGLYYFNARWYDPEMGRFITEDPARDGRNWFVYCKNNPLIFLDYFGTASILQRTINDSESNEAYHIAHIIGEKTQLSFILHGLIDRGELGGFYESNSVWQYSGAKSGFTTNDSGSKTDKYIIRYSGMDDILTEKAVNTVLQSEKFGNGDNEQAKKNYHIFKNDCNDFTKSVMREYQSEWKSQYKNSNSNVSNKDINKAWKQHYKEISVNKGKIYNATTEIIKGDTK